MRSMASKSPVRTTGRFAYDLVTGKCDWDDEVYRIHGYVPGSVEPTLDRVVDVQHPDDRSRVVEMIHHAARTGEPFAVSYRIVTPDGGERRVLLVGESGMCDPGEMSTVEGYYIDHSKDVEEQASKEIHEAVEATIESRIVIEQAKGAIMMAYGLDPDAAFAMLRWWSRNRNVKVREVAARLVGVAQDGELAFAQLRLRVDALLHDMTERPGNGYRAGMTEQPADQNRDEDQAQDRAEDQDRVADRADELLPEEQAAGSDDPHDQAEQILRESDARVNDPEGTGAASVQTSTPDQRPDTTQ